MKIKSFEDMKATPDMLAADVAHGALRDTVNELARNRPRPSNWRVRRLNTLADRCGKGKALVRKHPDFKAAMFLATAP